MRYVKRFIEFNRSLKSKPTKYFLFIIAVFFGLFLQAYMHNYNIVYIVLFVLFALAGTSCLVGRLNILPVRAEALASKAVFAGRDAKLYFTLFGSSSSDSYDLYLEKRRIGTLRAMEQKTLFLTKRFEKRGKARIRRLWLQSYFPFGHIRFGKYLQVDTEYIVYPKPAGRDLKKEFYRQLARYGQLESFDDLKPYEQGEKLSTVHWPSVAKGEPMSKRFTYSKDDIKLIFDFQTIPGSVEQRLSQICLWVLQASSAHIAYEVRLKTRHYSSKKEDTYAILEKLALY
ncbi:MAG: DUF58 domain-containing protein [Campylobacterota bacterium]